MFIKNSIRSIIIDDENAAVGLLKEMLKNIKGLTVSGTANSVSDGINLILSQRPDIVFLDIRLHEENGFELIRKLKEYDADPYFVMVTGFDQYGMEALKAGAFDYLLKPVDPAELLKVIARYRQKQSIQRVVAAPKKIRFNTLGGFILINPDEILYCQAAANYTDIILTNQLKHTISMNIGSIEQTLHSAPFFRISRSIIINVKFLSEINRRKRICVMTAGQVSVSLSIARESIKDLELFLVQQ